MNSERGPSFSTEVISPFQSFTNIKPVFQPESDFNEKYFSSKILKYIELLVQEKYAELETELSSGEETFSAFPLILFDILLIKIIAIFIQLRKALTYTFTFGKTKLKVKILDSLIASAKTIIEKLIVISSPTNDYHYEKVTQLQCELLYYHAIYSKRKKEYVNTFSYLSFSLDLMKIFLIKNKTAKDIRTYFIYALNVLFYIVLLIEDNNFIDGLASFEIFDELCFIMLKMCDEEFRKKIFFIIGIGLSARGTIYEMINLGKGESLISFKQSSFFLKYYSNEEEKKNFIEVLSDNIIEHYKLYFLEKKEKKEGNKEEIENQKDKIAEKIQKMKINVIKCDAYVYNNEKKKFKKIENFLQKNKSKKKLSDEHLVNFIDDHFSSRLNHKSPQTKNALCHFRLYNKLLSLEYKDYIASSSSRSKFEFDNPSTRKEAIDSMERYILKKKEEKIEKEKKIFKKIEKKPKINYFSQKFLNKTEFLENLEKKEYNFQKTFLTQQKSNAKFFLLNNSSESPSTEVKVKEKAELSFQLIKHQVKKQIEEFNYNKVKGFNLYAKVFQMNNKKKAAVSMNKVFKSYKKKNKLEKMEIAVYSNKKNIYETNLSYVARLDSEIEQLEKNTYKQKRHVHSMYI